MIEIGKVLQARESKLFMSKKYKENFANAEQKLAYAKKNLSIFGMYDDCGSSYEGDYEIAQGESNAAKQNLSLLISFEKNYKKLKHEFNESYPEYLDLLENHLEKQTKEIEQKYRSKV